MKFVDVSVAFSIIVPFKDHEHLVGNTCRRIAEQARALTSNVEIIFVDEGSGDNSQAVLALLRQEIPELQVVFGKGHAAGVACASKDVLLLADLLTAAEGLSESLAPALERVAKNELDMQLLAENLLICSRQKSSALIVQGLTYRQCTPRGILKRGTDAGLATETYGPESRGLSSTGLGRVLSNLVPRGSGLHRAW